MKHVHLLLEAAVPLDLLREAAAAVAPSLQTLLRRGRAGPVEPSRSALLCQALGVARQQDWPVAPLTARADGLAADKGYWLRLDPVHLEVGMGGLMPRSAADIGLTGEEARALVAAINAQLQDCTVLAPSPGRWYLNLDSPPDFATIPLDQALGEYLTPLLPKGRDAGPLLVRVNEAQMAMHDHPVNLKREAAGLPVVNGLWPWGGGTLPTTAPGLDLMASDDEALQTLARAAGVAAGPCPDGLATWVSAGGAERGWVALAPTPQDLALADCLARLERTWFRPLLAALVLGRIRTLRLDLLSRPGQSCRIDTLRSWRFWR